MDVYSELKNAQLEILAAGPTSPMPGTIYFQDSDFPLNVYDGTTTHSFLSNAMYDSIASNVASNFTIGAVDNTKIGYNREMSNSSGSFTTTSTSFVDVTNLSQSITTGGYPVEVYLIGDSVSSSNASGANTLSTITLLRDGVAITFAPENVIAAESTGSSTSSISIPPGAIRFLDYGPPAGTYTYKIQAKSATGCLTAVTNVRMYIREH